ncbi:SLATT domain-containing protein [Streptomyces europaeiscabiei]|uniref:SLATT domain-containing protein n=1 Tax=Streptomyces europaeiscabiei TaxID=146819 RepID=UPI0038D506CD
MTIRRPHSAPGSLSDDPILDYALRELEWFEVTRRRSRVGHYGVEFLALVTSSATVVAAGLQAPAGVTATIAGLAVFLAGLRQLLDHRARYVLAAEAWTRLHTAIERYRLLSPDERSLAVRNQLLDRIEAVVDSDFTSWGASLRQGGSGESLGEAPQEGR